MKNVEMLLETLNDYAGAIHAGELTSAQMLPTIARIVTAIEAEGYKVLVSKAGYYAAREVK